ncbi:MAG: hypothetical protein OXI89_00420 [Gemmatimonadota bacterium]|nr:hypothetical protein [Gemmatimonadota bacterium]
MPETRQKLLVLYLRTPDLHAGVVAWSEFDGASAADERHTSGDAADSGGATNPPYASVVDAMRDGWRVVQFPQQYPAYPGTEYQVSYLKYEYILEKMEVVDG